MNGEQITLIRRTEAGRDLGGDIIWQQFETVVPDVLIADGSQSASTDSTRPDGVTVAKTLYFPREFVYESLQGCRVRIDGHEYTVLGDPRPYAGGLNPTRWNLKVEVMDERG